MARPRKDDHGPSARARIEEAFWKLLEQKDYDGITVSALARTACVSPNTIYYHYANIEAVARSAFDENLVKELPALILRESGAAFERVISYDMESIDERSKRIIAFASSESGLLRSIVVDSFMEMWLKAIEINPLDLSFDERVRMEFIANGATSALGNMKGVDFFEFSPLFFNSPLGKGVIAEMKAIKQRHDEQKSKVPPETHPIKPQGRRGGRPDWR
ncbi:MAG: TetR/AcrR family transcriptional regulator [Slackia sp.]|nr:TetR/AcrR family transcriptional regulator [Slackia sp.]